MKQSKQVLGMILLALSMGAATAHGVSKPQHGGIVQVAHDVNFELVVEADGVSIYLVDHDEPMASKGVTGKLTVLQDGARSEVDIKAAEGNKLRATGVKIAPGAKLVAVLNGVEGKTATVRFSIK